jgi:membrane protein implicated in regulation of membrane protease activity
MFVFLLLLLILLAALGVLGLALKVALALFVGLTIAIVGIAVVGYYVVRHQLRKAQKSFSASLDTRATTSAGTTVEVGRPTRQDPPVDDRY